jgi:hypothetical protein
MSVKSKRGRSLSKADLERMAAQAEAGFDLAAWKPRRGRPALDADASEHAPRISVRLPRSLHDQVIDRAEQEGRAVSDVVRGLLSDYVADGLDRAGAATTSRTGR